MRTRKEVNNKRLDAAQKIEDSMRDAMGAALTAGMYDLGQQIIAIAQTAQGMKNKLLTELENSSEQIKRNLGEGI
jgi:peptide deformylase